MVDWFPLCKCHCTEVFTIQSINKVGSGVFLELIILGMYQSLPQCGVWFETGGDVVGFFIFQLRRTSCAVVFFINSSCNKRSIWLPYMLKSHLKKYFMPDHGYNVLYRKLVAVTLINFGNVYKNVYLSHEFIRILCFRSFAAERGRLSYLFTISISLISQSIFIVM